MSQPDAAPAVGTDIARTTARAFERDRYLAALLAPSRVRGDLVVLAALAGELSRIPVFVGERMIGEIRLQWWREAIDAGAGAGTRTGHPIADAVIDTIVRHGLPLATIHGLIDAQVDRLDPLPFADLDALLASLAAWDGGLFEIAWRVLGGVGERPSLLTASGQAYGISRMLVELPAAVAGEHVMAPRSMLASRGLSSPGLLDADAAGKWQALSTELAGHARHLLDELADEYRTADRSVRLAALPIALVRPYLSVTQRLDVLALEAGDIGPLTRVWRLWRMSRSGRL